MRITARGIHGHGGIPNPPEQNPIVRLSRAIERLVTWKRPVVVTPETRAWLDRLTAQSLAYWGTTEARLEHAVEASPGLRALFTDTLNVTMVQGGVKANVVPGRAIATLDCRLLPGQSRDAWRDEVLARIDDPDVRVEFFDGLDTEAPAPPPSTPTSSAPSRPRSRMPSRTPSSSPASPLAVPTTVSSAPVASTPTTSSPLSSPARSAPASTATTSTSPSTTSTAAPNSPATSSAACVPSRDRAASAPARVQRAHLSRHQRQQRRRYT